MKKQAAETLGYVVITLSIALFFLLCFRIEPHVESMLFQGLAWMLFGLGILLIVLSTVTLVRNQGAGLIKHGAYSIIRHPMYCGAMLLFLSWIFFLPHWSILLLSMVNIAITYWYAVQGEHQNIDKFGAEYERYMESVPRVNILAGLYRRLRNM